MPTTCQALCKALVNILLTKAGKKKKIKQPCFLVTSSGQGKQEASEDKKIYNLSEDKC